MKSVFALLALCFTFNVFASSYVQCIQSYKRSVNERDIILASEKFEVNQDPKGDTTFSGPFLKGLGDAGFWMELKKDGTLVVGVMFVDFKHVENSNSFLAEGKKEVTLRFYPSKKYSSDGIPGSAVTCSVH